MLQNIVMISDHTVSTFTLDYSTKSKNFDIYIKDNLIRQVSIQIGHSWSFHTNWTLVKFRYKLDRVLCHKLVPLCQNRTNVWNFCNQLLINSTSVKTDERRENITQIMWPSSYIPELRQGPIHQRLELLAKAILGDDMAFDFDMMISKVG